MKNIKEKKTDKFDSMSLEKMINKLNENSSAEEVKEILKKIPQNESLIVKDLLTMINTKIPKYSIRDLKNELKKICGERKNLEITKQTNLTIIKNREDEIYDYIRNTVIRNSIKDNKIYLLTEGEEIEIAGFGLDIMSYTINKKRNDERLYTFFVNGTEFYNYSVKNFIEVMESRIKGGLPSKDIIKHIFMKKEESLQPIEPSYILGFDNGWNLPLDSCPRRNSMIWYTPEELNVIKRFKNNIYQKYSAKEKKELSKELENIIKDSQIPEVYKSIVISWSIIAPFQLFFIQNRGLFPSLFLEGTKHTGKTSLMDFFGTHFYNHYDSHMTGTAAKRVTHFEEAATISTFPRVIDELREVSEDHLSILKEKATGIGLFQRYIFNRIEKPIITPFAITSNRLSEYFSDPAESSKAIILNFNKVISMDLSWLKLYNKLKKEKLFSLMYDYTKDWTNDDLQKLTDEAILNLKCDADEKKLKFEKIRKNGLELKDIIRQRLRKYETDYPRLFVSFEILLSGALLIEKMCGFKLDTSEIFEQLLFSRGSFFSDLIDRFFEFVEEAMEFERGKSPRYIEHKLIVESKTYGGKTYDKAYFLSENLRDYNNYEKGFSNSKYGLDSLYEALSEHLTSENKYLINLSTYRNKGKAVKCIAIHEDFWKGHFTGSRKVNKKITSLEDFFKEVDIEEQRIIAEDEEYNDKILSALAERKPIWKIEDIIRPIDIKQYKERLEELLKEDQE